MASTESLVFDLLVRDSASAGLNSIGKAADGASRNTDALTARLNELSRKSVEARVRLAGDKEALASLDKMDARLISLDRRVASPNLKVDGAARAIAEISAVDLEMDRLGGKGGSAEKAGLSLSSLSGAVMPALIGAGVALSPVIATVAAGVGGLGAAAYGTVSPILAAAQATGGLQANMKTLSPVQQQMARELLGLEGTASAFSRSLQPQVVKLWGDGLRVAGGVLHDIQPAAKGAGDGLHSVLDNINAQLQTQQWRDFFTFMGQTAGGDIRLLGDNLTTFMALLPQLLTDLQPMAVALLHVTDAGGKVLGFFQQAERASFPWLALQNKSATGGDAVATALAAAAAATARLGRATVTAAPQVGTLSGDVAILGTTTSQSALALQAYSDEWAIFVGKSVGNQQAVLNVTAAFEAFAKTVHQSGRASTAAQQAFLGIFTAIGSGLDALHKNGASVSQLNDFYTTSIARLGKLHGLTPAQRADVQGLTKDYVAWASSVTGLSGNTVKAAGVIRQDFLTALSLTHKLAPSARADADALAASILKTGTNSRATATDRAKLIRDLEKSGLSAFQAKADVLGFQSQIDKLRGKAVHVDLVTSGHGQIIISGTGINTRTINTATGQVRGPGGHTLAAGGIVPGGYSRTDNQLAWVRSGEGVLQPGAVAALGGPAFIHRANALYGDVPVRGHFAAGGVVGRVAAAEGSMGTAQAQWGQLAAQALAASAVQASMKAAAAAASSGGGSVARWAPLILQALAMLGQSSANLGAVEHRMAQESGGNQYAINLSDINARRGDPSRGLMQVIGATFARYRSYNLPDDIYNPLANIFAGLNYAVNAYAPRPLSSVMLQAGGYDAGGYLPPGLSLAWNGTGRPEPVGPAAGATYVINVAVMPGGEAEAGRVIVEKIRAFEKRSGKGWRS